MNAFLRTFRYLAQWIAFEKRWLCLGMGLTMLLSSLVWVGPRWIGWIVDHAVIPGDHSNLLWGVTILLLIELSRLFTVFLSQVVYSVLGQNVIERVRSHMISHLLKLPISYFDRISSGRMMTRVVSDVNSLSDFFQSGFVSVLGNVANVTAIFLGLFSLNFKLGLVLFVSFVPMVVACGFFSKKLKFAYERSRTQLSHLNAMLADFLFGMKTIRSLSQGRSKYQELDSQIQEYAKAQMYSVQTFALFHPTLSLGIGVMLLIHMVFGLPLVSDHTLKVGEWIAGLSYVLFLQQPLVEISDRWNFFLIGLTSVDRILEVVEVKPEANGAVVPSTFKTIRFEHMSFGYGSGEPAIPAPHALKNVSIEIKQGDWVGVFGESGSGKSTFLQMIFGFYLPVEGQLFWNGESYAGFDRGLITQKFGVVEQFPFLFSGSVRENLTLFGNREVDLVKLKEKFKGFSLIESVLESPDVHVHERGTNLSMGQKQMIAFLRAYLAHPEIWILDEATAFFDHEAEQEVMRVLAELHAQKPVTVIQVAHRPEALSKMKRWFRVESGHLEEWEQWEQRAPSSTTSRLNSSDSIAEAKNPGPQDL